MSQVIRDKNNRRIKWVDCVKGLGILSVILGHTITFVDGITEQAVRCVIFSFHMPLFFIMSGFTFKPSSDYNKFLEKTERSFKSLFLVAVLLYVLWIIDNIFKLDWHNLKIASFSYPDWQSYCQAIINAFVYYSGADVKVQDTMIPAIGMGWFLIVLFFARTVFDLFNLKLERKKVTMVVCLCCVGGLLLGRIQWLPLSFDITLAILPFLWVGYYLQKINFQNRPLRGVCISFLLYWLTFLIFLFANSVYLNLSLRKYPLFPLCYVTAIAGTMFLCYISQYLCHLSFFSKLLVYLGRYSLYLLCVHCIDMWFKPLWNLTQITLLNGVFRIVIDSVVCFVLVELYKLLTKFRNKDTQLSKS